MQANAPPSYDESVSPDAVAAPAALDLSAYIPFNSPFIKQEDVDLMMSMGFQKSFCQVALIRCSGNVNDAISMVLENNESTMAAFVREYRSNHLTMTGQSIANNAVSNPPATSASGSSSSSSSSADGGPKTAKKSWSLFGLFKSEKKETASIILGAPVPVPPQNNSLGNGHVQNNTTHDEASELNTSRENDISANDSFDNGKPTGYVFAAGSNSNSNSSDIDLPPPPPYDGPPLYDGPPPNYEDISVSSSTTVLPIPASNDAGSNINSNNNSNSNSSNFINGSEGLLPIDNGFNSHLGAPQILDENSDFSSPRSDFNDVFFSTISASPISSSFSSNMPPSSSQGSIDIFNEGGSATATAALSVVPPAKPKRPTSPSRRGAKPLNLSPASAKSPPESSSSILDNSASSSVSSSLFLSSSSSAEVSTTTQPSLEEKFPPPSPPPSAKEPTNREIYEDLQNLISSSPHAKKILNMQEAQILGIPYKPTSVDDNADDNVAAVVAAAAAADDNDDNDDDDVEDIVDFDSDDDEVICKNDRSKTPPPYDSDDESAFGVKDISWTDENATSLLDLNSNKLMNADGSEYTYDDNAKASNEHAFSNPMSSSKLAAKEKHKAKISSEKSSTNTSSSDENENTQLPSDTSGDSLLSASSQLTSSNVISDGFDVSQAATVDWDFKPQSQPTSANVTSSVAGFPTIDRIFNWELSSSVNSYFETNVTGLKTSDGIIEGGGEDDANESIVSTAQKPESISVADPSLSLLSVAGASQILPKLPLSDTEGSSSTALVEPSTSTTSSSSSIATFAAITALTAAVASVDNDDDILPPPLPKAVTTDKVTITSHTTAKATSINDGVANIAYSSPAKPESSERSNNLIPSASKDDSPKASGGIMNNNSNNNKSEVKSGVGSSKSSSSSSSSSKSKSKAREPRVIENISQARFVSNMCIYGDIISHNSKAFSVPSSDRSTSAVYPIIADVMMPYKINTDEGSICKEIKGAYTTSRNKYFENDKIIQALSQDLSACFYIPIAAPLPMSQGEIDEYERNKDAKEQKRRASLQERSVRESSLTFSISKNLWGERNVEEDVDGGSDEDAAVDYRDSSSFSDRTDATSIRFKRRVLLPYKLKEIPPQNGEEASFSGMILLKQPKLSEKGKEHKSPQGNRPDVISTPKCPTRLHIVRLCESLSPPIWAGLDDPQTCTICKHSFAYFRPGHHCRNCGHWVCEHCSSKCWPSTMIPDSFHDNEKVVRVCDTCVYLTESFADALRSGDLNRCLAIYETGSVNLRQPLDIYVTGEYPIHSACQGGSLEIVKWLLEDRLVPIIDDNNKKLITSTGLSVLAVAAKYGRHEIMLYLVQNGCTVDEITDISVLVNGLHAALLCPGPLPDINTEKKSIFGGGPKVINERVIVNRDTTLNSESSDFIESETVDSLTANIDTLPKARYINSHPRVNSFPYAGIALILGPARLPGGSSDSSFLDKSKVPVTETSNPNIVLVDRPLWVKDYRSTFDSHLKLSSGKASTSGFKVASAVAEAVVQKELNGHKLLKENTIRFGLGASMNTRPSSFKSSSSASGGGGGGGGGGGSEPLTSIYMGDLYSPIMNFPIALPYNSNEVSALERDAYYKKLLNLSTSERRSNSSRRLFTSSKDMSSPDKPKKSHDDASSSSSSSSISSSSSGNRIRSSSSSSSPSSSSNNSRQSVAGNNRPSATSQLREVRQQLNDPIDLELLRNAPSPPSSSSSVSSSSSFGSRSVNSNERGVLVGAMAANANQSRGYGER